jgi:hypothetical protein
MRSAQENERRIATATPPNRLTTQRSVLQRAAGDAHGCNNDALWVQPIPDAAGTGLIMVTLLLVGAVVVRVMTGPDHSEVRAHTTSENGNRVTLDIGVLDLRGSLP